MRNVNKVKQSGIIKAIEDLKRRIRSSIGRAPIVGKLNARELVVPISQTLTHHTP